MNALTMERVKCPYCGRTVALTPLGYLYKHKVPSRNPRPGPHRKDTPWPNV